MGKDLDYISVLGLRPNRLIIFPLFVTLDLTLYYKGAMLLNKMFFKCAESLESLCTVSVKQIGEMKGMRVKEKSQQTTEMEAVSVSQRTPSSSLAYV